MIRTGLSALAISVLLVSTATGETKRQHGAHEHGHGKLNMAVEGSKLHIELEVPGADIVGFEHAAKSESDKQKVEGAQKTLQDPLSIIALPADAGCKLALAEVEIGADEHESHDKHGSHAKKEHAHEHKHGEKEEKHEEAEHSEVHAVYALTCSRIDSINAIAFPYFKNFPNSEELDVTFIGPKGQRSFEVNRENSRIDLSGMM